MVQNQIRNSNQIIDLLIVIAIVFMIPRLSSALTNIIYPAIQNWDPDEVFLYKSIHHLFQFLLTIMTILLASKKLNFAKWGFNLMNWRTSLKWVFIFFLVWGTMQFIGISKNPFEIDYDLSFRNQIGVQFFQYFLSGTGEEPLFRGFVMVYLGWNWNKIFTVGKIQIPITLILATLLFMLAHVSIDISSLKISHIDFGQQMNSLQLGIVYGLAFHQTKSLLAPVIMHGISNGVIYSIMFYLIN